MMTEAKAEASFLLIHADASFSLSLRHDELVSNFAVKFNLRNYTWVKKKSPAGATQWAPGADQGQGLTLAPVSAQLELLCPPYNPD